MALQRQDDHEDHVRRRARKEEEAGEVEHKKLPYPKAIWFIVGNEFCERFSYYGMKAILSIYIKNKLHFSEDASTVIYHTFSLFCYFTPLFGAMLADQLLGKFKTIFWISIIYVIGHLFKTVAAIPTLGVPPVEFSLLGLALIAIGTGGIKPCVSAFGGDQFKLPEQERQLQTFFSVFYFAINSGSLISVFLTPVLRQDVKCFGDDTCYSLAFGVPAALMFIATVILVMGKSMYVMKPPQGNILTSVCGSIWYALKRKFTSSENHEHWMDHARDVYGRDLVEDVKLLLRVLCMYIPIPVFWALFDQQGSRWTFQATRMSGAFGSYIIKPDQMQLVNPALILILIPLFDGIIYPSFAKVGFLVRPLQRMCVGGLLTAFAFVISGFLELQLMHTYDRIPALDESHLHVMNTLGCPIDVRVSNTEGLVNRHIELETRMSSVLYDLRPGLYDVDVRVGESCQDVREFIKRYQVEAKDQKVLGIVIRSGNERSLGITELTGFEDPKKYSGGQSKIRVVFDVGSSSNQSAYLKYPDSSEGEGIKIPGEIFEGSGLQESVYAKVNPGTYDFYVGDLRISTLDIGQGGVRTFYVSGNQDLGFEPQMTDFTLTTENSIHMFWIIPQYAVITTGEIMFSITGLEFSYSQSPESMKSVLQAAWLLTVAFGNLIVIIVAEARAFDNQASEFFMFAALMFIDVIILSVMAYYYKYVDVAKRERERKQEDLKMHQRSGLDNDGYAGSTDF